MSERVEWRNNLTDVLSAADLNIDFKKIFRFFLFQTSGLQPSVEFVNLSLPSCDTSDVFVVGFFLGVCVCVCVCVCARACVRACVRACACVRAPCDIPTQSKDEKKHFRVHGGWGRMK